MAVRVARSIDLPHIEIDTHELDDPDYVNNAPDRCYFCKAELYQRLLNVMHERGFKVVLDGSNADDLDDHRPGLAAARELGVRSPLQEVGLTKAEIRVLSKRAGLPTWEIPASPCLASRIAYGLEVTPQRLRAIEEAEARLRDLHPWRELRVRYHGGLARLEVAPEDIDSLREASLRECVVQALRQAGFGRACLDLQGYRRGALNESLSREGSDMLAVAGLDAAVESAGLEGEVAIIRYPHAKGQSETLSEEERRISVESCTAAGFRYVTLELY
jgi:uncharacterized protein